MVDKKCGQHSESLKRPQTGLGVVDPQSKETRLVPGTVTPLPVVVKTRDRCSLSARAPFTTPERGWD